MSRLLLERATVSERVLPEVMRMGKRWRRDDLILLESKSQGAK
jgi:hypothetical protein